MSVINGNVNIYTPRSMEPAFEKNMPVTTFFRDTFFPVVRTYPTEAVDMDFRKGAYLIAPFVAPNVGGINMDRKGYETKTYSPPRIAPQRVISPEVLQPRLPGETVHTSMTPEQRQEYFMQQDAQEMDDAITRREEVMCAELLTNGQINVRGYMDDNLSNYVDDVINYQFTQKTILSGTNMWTDAGSDKIGDLEDGVETVFKAGYNAAICVMGKDAWNLFKSDDNVIKMFDKIRVDIGTLNPQLRQNGLKYCGTISELGIEIWVYYGYYKDYDGTVKPIMPDDHVIIAPGSLGAMLYGAVTQLEDDNRYHTYEGTRVPKIWGNLDNDVMKYRLSSRPIPKPNDVDAWVSIKVK